MRAENGEVLAGKNTEDVHILSDIYNDDNLYKEYPELKDLKIKFTNDETFVSAYSASDKAILIPYKMFVDYSERDKAVKELQKEYSSLYDKSENKQSVKDEFLSKKEELGKMGGIIKNDSNRGNFSLKTVLSHEIQHYIQDIEGFPSGGSINTKGIQRMQRDKSISFAKEQLRPYEDKLKDLYAQEEAINTDTKL